MAKSVDAFRTISEVAEDLGVPKHVLRFWEVKFAQIRPMKRGGGRRYYRPEDMELLKGIRYLLHREGYTIKGVQKILREQGVEAVKLRGRLQPGGAPAEGQPPVHAAPEPGLASGSALRAASAKPAKRRAGGGRQAEMHALVKEAIAELMECKRILHGEAPSSTLSVQDRSSSAQ